MKIMSKFADLSLTDYLAELSSDKAVPGGGSVSAYTAALAMGLTQMVGRIALNRKKKKDLTPEENQKDDTRREIINEVVESLEKTKKDAFEIVDLDPQVYQAVMDSYSDPEKMEDALQNSFRLQADLTLLVIMAKEWNETLADHVKGSVKNDLIVSAGMYEAAFKGAYHTAMINVVYMKNEKNKKHAEEALEELKHRFEKGNVRVKEERS